MKKFYYVAVIEDNGKRGAFVYIHTEGSCLMARIRGLTLSHLYPYETKKKAQEVADEWNNCARKEGKNLY